MEKMIEEVKALLGEGYEVVEVNVSKNNGVVYKGINIRHDGESISPNIYIEEGMTAYDIVSTYRKTSVPEDDFDVRSVISKEYMLANVYPVLINKEKNSDKLDDIVHREYADLEIAYRVMISNDIFGVASYMIKKNMINILGIDEQELHDTAIKNITGKCIARSMLSMISKLSGVPEDCLNGDEDPGIVLTSNTGVNGSYAVLDENLMNELHERLGDEFYLIPSSVHEMIAMPKDDRFDPSDLVGMISEVNSTVLDEVDFLSDRLYTHKAGIGMEVAA